MAPARLPLASVLLLASLLASALAASAQGTVAPVPPALTVLEDRADDLVANGVPLPTSVAPSLDLRSLALTDDDDSVTFRLGLAEAGAAPFDTSAIYRVSFKHGSVQYHLNVRQEATLGVYYDAYLYRYSDALQQDVWAGWSAADVSPSDGTVSVAFEKGDLVDEHGAAPFPTRTLGPFTVEASMRALGGDAVHVPVDRMPDSGDGSTPYPIRSGPPQTGGLSLWTDQPFRSSNGEATTYVYSLKAEDRGAAATVRLSADGLPANWDVRFPQEELDLRSGASADVQVVVTVPFAHVHGSRPSFLLRMADERDPSRAALVRLGVDYPAVPQASGHHADLTFHSQRYNGDFSDLPVNPYTLTRSGGFGYAWMTPLDDDPDDEGVALPGQFYDDGPTDVDYYWWVYTSMTLGLDFDLTKPVQLAVPVSTGLPLPGATVKADLFYSWRTADGGWDSTRIATLGSGALDLAAGSSHLFQLEGLPTAESDRIAPHREAYLGWQVELKADRPGTDAGGQSPLMQPGGHTHLPLVDYHDAVDEVYAALDGVRLAPAGPGTRLVNPGETVLYDLTLGNGGEGGAFHLALGGQHAAWARILGGDRIDVGAGEERMVRVAVSAPADAADGQALDLLVEAHGPGGATALLRLGGLVVTGTDEPDEAGLADAAGGHDSPAPAAALLAVGLLALVALRRRQAS
jgi:hypothetical protein